MNERKNLLIVLGEWWEQRRADSRSTAPTDPPNHLRRLLRWLTPNGGTLLLIAILLLTQNAWARPAASPAAAPGPSATTVNYQGRLADSGGVPLDGSYGMSFALYDALTDGSIMWGPENHIAVPVSAGLFSVGLGSLTAGGIPTSVWDGDRYLEITVGGETLNPRELIRSVPVAGMALTVPDGTIDQAKAPFALTGPGYRMESGSVSLAADEAGFGNNFRSKIVNFSTAFSDACPVVVLTNSAQGWIGWFERIVTMAGNVNQSTFEAAMFRVDGGPIVGPAPSLEWVAFGCD